MNENIANFIGKEGFNWWVGQVENDGSKYWNAELEDGNGDFDYGDFDWTNKVKVRTRTATVESRTTNNDRVRENHTKANRPNTAAIKATL